MQAASLAPDHVNVGRSMQCLAYAAPTLALMHTPNASRTALACLAATLMVLIWSGIHPKDRGTWLMEVLPVLIAVPLVLFTWKRFPLTTLLTAVITLHAIVLMVGGRYTYAEMPLFNWIRDEFHLSRNHYDRLGHFMQGFAPALVIRELLLRTSTLKAGKWLATIIIFCCLGVSAITSCSSGPQRLPSVQVRMRFWRRRAMCGTRKRICCWRGLARWWRCCFSRSCMIVRWRH